MEESQRRQGIVAARAGLLRIPSLSVPSTLLIYLSKDPGEVTCSLFVSSQGKLLIGRADGLIVMSYACETLARQLLEVSLEKPTTCRLVGHKGAVRWCFIHNTILLANLLFILSL